MSLLDDALNKQSKKRSQRLEVVSDRSKKDAQKIKYATYLGKSAIDGTDIVQIGSNEPVSGFRLISNAPVSIGEKVALRPNQSGGLQRVDARNRAPIVEDVTVEEIISAYLVFINLDGFNPIKTLTLDAQSNADLGGLLKYNYVGKRLKNKSRFTENNNTFSPITTVGDYEQNFRGANNFIVFNYPSNFFSGATLRFIVFFPIKSFNLIEFIGSFSGATYSTSPLEVEVKVDDVVLDPLIFGTSFTLSQIGIYYELNVSSAFNSQTGTSTKVDFRCRRRVTDGTPLPWFQL
jgi:hypothetical protein